MSPIDSKIRLEFFKRSRPLPSSKHDGKFEL